MITSVTDHNLESQSKIKMPFYLLQGTKVFFPLFNSTLWIMQGCVFTRDINKAMLISDAMETGTVQINSAPSRGPDHFPFQVKYCSTFAKLP